MKNSIFLLFLLIFLGGCFEAEPKTPLKNTYWSLIELQGEEALSYENQPQIHLVFHINDNTLHGSDGCNRLSGQYSKDRNNFTIEKIASTRMMCKEGMKQANTFLQTLTKTDRIKIEEDYLILFHADIEIARFEAKEAY